jgi:hypothetical protein
MKIKYKIIDNFLPKENFDIIKKIIFESDFNWFYNKGVNNPNEDSLNMLFYFTHMFYFDNVPLSPYFKLININLLSKLNIKSLIRVKCNLYTYQNKKNINGMHVDYDYPHKGAIFYLNTNNGRTILSDKIKIDSVENRVLFFDPSIKHDSENCTDQKIRVNININYF